MSVNFPNFTYIGVDGFQMFPGTTEAHGIHHQLTPGLHLIAGVNGLGKSTFLLMLYHGLVGPAAIHNDDFGVALPQIAPLRDREKFRQRVADGARDARSEMHFLIGDDRFEVTRSLHDLTLVTWKFNGSEQVPNQDSYMRAVVDSMNVGSFAAVIVILNLIVFMFESRTLLMWSAHAQRNALRALFMTPSDANELAKLQQAVATANSAYRNLLYISNRDRKKLASQEIALEAAGSLSTEYHTLQSAMDAHDDTYESLIENLRSLDEERTATRTTCETAKFYFDDILREIEALKLARVASAFPSSDDSSRYVIARLMGDHECLACGSTGGQLVAKWSAFVANGHCFVCGSGHELQETVIPPVAVDTARLDRASTRLVNARQALKTATENARAASEQYDRIQGELDDLARKRTEVEKRIQQIAGQLPSPPHAISALQERVERTATTLEQLRHEQLKAEYEFSLVFDRFRTSVEQKADLICDRFGRRISEFLVEKAQISLTNKRSAIGESGQSYDWPTFSLSMTSGTFSAPAPRQNRADVSMSQGEFIDLAFRLALVEVAAESGPASMIFDAPEASLDALFMRRAGAFLAQFTSDNHANRLIVTSNLTNADMIPALFGAYERQAGDPEPRTIPRSERHSRVVNLLELAAPTTAITIVGDRYNSLLDRALFPPNGKMESGL
jgi:predicted  nucleic acid-binding Zn-ribbon protein